MRPCERARPKRDPSSVRLHAILVGSQSPLARDDTARESRVTPTGSKGSAKQLLHLRPAHR